MSPLAPSAPTALKDTLLSKPSGTTVGQHLKTGGGRGSEGERRGGAGGRLDSMNPVIWAKPPASSACLRRQSSERQAAEPQWEPAEA